METAVEWLEEQQKELVIQIINGEFQIEDFEYYNAIYIEQAKEMEKQQLYKFYVQGGIDCITQADRTVEDYYINTFKSE